ncbi:hypothetical protein NC981_25070 [Leptolyngbya sp. DQ-M1]|uniref:hypothetical protein n=1 Tax=Leptolyngbya sp. DQ-M1 TaxID=2933920 RepID=UPI0032982C52
MQKSSSSLIVHSSVTEGCQIYVLVRASRQAKATKFKGSKFKKGFEFEVFPPMPGLYGSSGQLGSRFKARFFGLQRYEVRKAAVGALNKQLFRGCLSPQRQLFLSVCPHSYRGPYATGLSSLDEGVHLEWPLALWKERLLARYGSLYEGLDAKLLRDMTATECGALETVLLQACPPGVPKLLALVPYLGAKVLPLGMYSHLIDYLCVWRHLQTKGCGQEFLALIRQEVGPKYYYRFAYRALYDMDNGPVAAFSFSYRLLGLKLFSLWGAVSSEPPCAGGVYSLFAEGACTPAQEVEKFRGLQLNGVAPKANSLVWVPRLELAALSYILAGPFRSVAEQGAHQQRCEY